MTRAAAVIGSAVALGACAAGSPGQGSAPASDTITVTGIVRVVGADPLTQLVVQTEGADATAIVGPLQSELQQAVGLEVRITGVVAPATPPAPRALAVSAYEVVSVNGAPVYTGIVERAGDELHLAGANQRWTLASPPDELRGVVGAKAWVSGDASGGTLRVAAYGILRRAPS